MQVFKFGGASVKNAEAIKKVAKIIQSASMRPLLVVISAMGSVTNALERVWLLHRSGQSVHDEVAQIVDYHANIVRSLFSTPDTLLGYLKALESDILAQLERAGDADQRYDQVVSLGEIVSTRIINDYLHETGISSAWIDARKYIVTDSTYREAKVDWEVTEKRIKNLQAELDDKIVITQGFIGMTDDEWTTTLGREGSDFSAAIFAYCLNAESVTIWKDVPGVMSADPKRLPGASTFDELPFREAAEMTYYGASVIHPKTIKPLANKSIPLLVKNFDDTTLPGTRIHECKIEKLSPLIVFKDNQCLVSCHVTDYTFIDESQIGIIFNALSTRKLKVNLMQNSAISFSFCLDFKEEKVLDLIKILSQQFEVYYNTGLTLITIKNYDTESFEKYRKLKGVILEQSSRSTLQVLVRS